MRPLGGLVVSPPENFFNSTLRCDLILGGGGGNSSWSGEIPVGPPLCMQPWVDL